MNNIKDEKDLLFRRYINPERREKAPEGFTSKVMMHIQLEKIPVKPTGILSKNWFVPSISSATVLLLLVAAVLSPASGTDSVTIYAVKIFKSLKIALPELDFTPLIKLNLPVTLIYVFIGILVLTLFDRALYGVFHKENQMGKS